MQFSLSAGSHGSREARRKHWRRSLAEERPHLPIRIYAAWCRGYGCPHLQHMPHRPCQRLGHQPPLVRPPRLHKPLDRGHVLAAHVQARHSIVGCGIRQLSIHSKSSSSYCSSGTSQQQERQQQQQLCARTHQMGSMRAAISAKAGSSWPWAATS